MSSPPSSDSRYSEKGIALLIALFALLLISGISAALIIASGTERGISANYRSSTRVFYAAYSGLEEARGRMWRNYPDSLLKTSPCAPNPPGCLQFITPPGGQATAVAPFLPTNGPTYGTTLAFDQVRYIINAAGVEVVNPRDPANPYYDKWYFNDFGVRIENVPAANVKTTISTSSCPAALCNPPLPGPPYKWVRITANTKGSSGVNVDCDTAGAGVPCPWPALQNVNTPLFYDGLNENVNSTGSQVFTATSLAVLPDGTRRMLQYNIAPDAPIMVDAAIHTLATDPIGQALNVTGNTGPGCGNPSTAGVRSGGAILPTDNVTGAPSPVKPYVDTTTTPGGAPFHYNVQALMTALRTNSSNIYDPKPPATRIPLTGVTGTGANLDQPPYTGLHAVLGTRPTAVATGLPVATNVANVPAIIIPSGAPQVYYSPGDLTLGTNCTQKNPVKIPAGCGPPAVGPGPNGQGMLLVNGNLTIDITRGFDYYGLILVTGNVIFVANIGTAAMSNVQGTIIAGGDFDSSDLSNLGGSIFITQNSCLIQSQVDKRPPHVISFREYTR